MADVQPFSGLRYDPRRVTLEHVIAPPRGKIDDAEEARLLSQDPRNIARIVCDGTRDRHRSAYLIADWLRAGILREEPQAAYYLLRESWTDEAGVHRREGFFGHVTGAASGRILPHERTVPGRGHAPRGIREPIFLLYEDPSGRVARILGAEVAERVPDVSCEAFDVHFELFIIDDETACARVAAELSSTDLLIADGHHRFASYQKDADEEGRGAGPFMAFLSSVDDPGNHLTAIHRAVDIARFDRDTFVVRASRYFEVRAFYSDESVPTAFKAAQGHAFVLLHEGERFLFTLKKDAPLAQMAGLPTEGPLRRIEAPLLDALVIRNLLEIEGAGSIRYLNSVAEVEAALEEDPRRLGILLPDPRIEDVLEAARAGLLLPEKTTCFSPKVPNGLVVPP